MKKSTISFVLCGSIFLYGTVYAKSVPVVSPGSTPVNPMYVEDNSAIIDLGKQLDALGQAGDIYQEMTHQLTELTNFHDDLQQDLNGLSKLKDGTSMGDILNDMDTIQSSWTWTANDWQSTLQAMSGGDNGRYQSLVSAYQKEYPSLNQSTLQKDNVESSNTSTYLAGVNVNDAVSTQSAYQFNNINTQMENVKNLANDINQTATDKDSEDLNSRLVAQLAYIQLAMLRMETLNNQALAEKRAAELQDDKNNIDFASHEITP